MIRPLTIALICLGPAIASAQEDAHMGHQMTESASDAASTVAYKAAMEKMHKDMMVDYTGDADVDFIRGMIPHHQGAVDMAKIVLEHGKDPEVRKLATDVVKTQEAEIEMMQNWLDQHDKTE